MAFVGELSLGGEIRPVHGVLPMALGAKQLGIASLSAEETAPQETGERPSIVLRQMAAGETLWDIAKAYQTTVNEIQQANDMEDQPTEPGVLLLIPRTR